MMVIVGIAFGIVVVSAGLARLRKGMVGAIGTDIEVGGTRKGKA
jgi:hypothetical protein